METDVRGLLGIGGMLMSASASASRDGNDANALAVLRRLLNLRNHLAAARGILGAASGWDETMDSVPSLLAASPPDLAGAVSALARLERGARALRGMPEGRAERDAALSKLRAQLEALLRPRLLHALKRMDTRLGPLQQCVGMYRSLGRMDAMREEYVRMRPGEMHALWFGFGSASNSEAMSMYAPDANAESKAKGAENGDGRDEDEDEDGDRDGAEGTSSTSSTSSPAEPVEDFDFADSDGADPLDLDIAPSTPASARQFAEFLPRFYESVLDLLGRERQQSRQVFGPDLAPAIVVRVLAEAFRPIVPSFGRRLGNLCPAPGPGRGLRAGPAGAEGGGTEAVAAAYGATLRFLSLAYEAMDLGSALASAPAAPSSASGARKKDAPGAGAGAGAGAGTGPGEAASSAELLASVREAFELVASPFVPYQRSLAEAERDSLGRASSLAARDVRGVSGMDGAAERMAGLARRMFPLAEGECLPACLPACMCLLAFRCREPSSLRAFGPSIEPFPSHF